MKINSQTKISVLIKENIEVIDAIASINSHFNKLRNPILRRILASRVTIEDAARIGKCTLKDLMNVLESIGFDIEKEEKYATNSLISDSKITRTNSFVSSMHKTLDVRPILDKGVDPFKMIMEEIKNLPNGYTLEIINSFEPTPLIKLLAKKGFKSWVRSDGDAIITSFLKDTTSQSVESEVSLVNILNEDEMELKKKKFNEKLNEVDVRLMEMPLPMVTILNHLKNLPVSYGLYVYHKKIPQFLLPELEERGFKTWIAELNENDIRLLIHR